MNGNNSGTIAPEPNQIIDLDQFLNLQADQSAQSGGSSARVEMPEADRVVMVGIFADDSGSMENLRQAVIDGLKMSVEAFKGAKGSDFYLDVRGFCGTYFSGMLKDVKDDSFDRYDPSFGSTPLISHAISHIKGLTGKAKQYRSMGIPTTIALLIMTDGDPNHEEEGPADFKDHIESANYIVGMGFAESNSEEAVRKYRNLFKEMGITKTVTPKSAPAEVRHAINQFSQSVASIASA